jgi:UPF0755 protein
MSERTARATKRAAAAQKRRAAESHSKKGRNPLHVNAAIAAGLVVVLVLVGIIVVPRLFKRGTATVEDYPSGETVYVTIPEGAGGTQIASLLLENHVISSDSAFYQEVQKQNADANMKNGTYEFVTGATVSEVVRQLVSGPNATQFQLKLAEGLTVQQTAAQIEEQLGISAEDFLEQAKASNYMEDYPFLQSAADDSLEGFLFAKTYDLGGTDMSADAVIRVMLNQFQSEVMSLDFDAAREAIYSRYPYITNIPDGDISDYDILIISSVVEREAMVEDDRPLIASVFYNRLGRVSPDTGYVQPYLQSDATMMYVTGGAVTADDLQTDSPYNTYLYEYLPPTPICSPSLASIKATLDPASTDYFYFFINDNVHQFSQTYAEHQQAISTSLNS